MNDYQNYTNKLLENFNNNKYLPALRIIVLHCIQETGFNNQELINKINEMLNVDELKKLSETSFLKKQVMKSLIDLDDESRKTIFKELIEHLKKNTENISVEQISTIKKVEFETKIKNIKLKINSEYKKYNDEYFDFSAKYNDVLDFKIKSHNCNDKTEGYKEKLLEKYINQISNENDSIKILNDLQNQKIEKQEMFQLGWIHTKKDIDTILIEGSKENTNEKRIYSISLINYNSGFHSTFDETEFLLVIIQSCIVNEYTIYKKIIEENIKDSIFYVIGKNDCLELKVENKIFKLEIRDDTAVLLQPEIKFGQKNSPEFIFDYEACGYESIEDFKENFNLFIDVFDKVLNKKQQILESLYSSALKFYLDWEEIKESDMEYVKAHTEIYSIEIYDDSAKIQASGSSDDDEELLGGHFIEAYIEKEDLNLENIVLDWYLS